VNRRILCLTFLASLSSTLGFAADPAGSFPKQESETGITHSFVSFGETYIMGADGKVLRSYPAGSRDGWLLPNGNLLIAVSKGGKEFPGGGAVEVTPENKVIWEFKGTQSEVNTVQAVGDGRYMLTEAGKNPRILEVDRDGKIVVEVPIQAQTKDFHLQTRMTRKLANGNYLVPQLLDKVVREYAPDGKIVWEAKTPADVKDAWPFTAIRLENGNTLVNCTHGLMVVEFDKDARIIWQLTNADLPHPYLADPCGGQRLPNGDTVIASYGQGKPGEVKLFEVTPGKKVVWIYRDDKKHGIHEVQIIDTNGKPIEGKPMR
jgi:hypothetical protein